MPHRTSTANSAHRARNAAHPIAPVSFAAIMAVAVAVTGCASLTDWIGGNHKGRRLVDPLERPDRIATLQASIEADHEALEALVAGERDDRDGPLHGNKELRGIAERLSQDEDELEALLRAENAAP